MIPGDTAFTLTPQFGEVDGQAAGDGGEPALGQGRYRRRHDRKLAGRPDLS